MKHTYYSRTVLHTYEYTVQYYDKATVVTYTKLEWLLRIYISERLLWHMYTYIQGQSGCYSMHKENYVR